MPRSGAVERRLLEEVQSNKVTGEEEAYSHIDLVDLAANARSYGVDVIGDEDFTEEVDLVVALGGDGTMLGAMRLVAKRPVPVLGENYGNVGFLVEIEPPELEAALERLSAGDYQLEPHHALEALSLVDALADAIRVLRRAHPTVAVSIVVVLDGCTDRTA
ncbi:NAD(+)/NADH kinase, partial [Bacillus sp. S34]|nr:NAD(+)/NADH kinase [Bacillus sp. S34]